MIKSYVEDITNKLRQQKEDYDKLMDGEMKAAENLKLKQEELKEDTEIVEEQDKQLEELKKLIEAEQETVDQLTLKIHGEPGRKEKKGEMLIKQQEEERNRYLQQTHEALKAKKEFIEKEYDFETPVEDIKTEIFKEIMKSNESVNQTVTGFIGKVETVKDDIRRLQALNYKI